MILTRRDILYRRFYNCRINNNLSSVINKNQQCLESVDMKIAKSIKNVLDESDLNEDDYRAYSGFLQSKLAQAGSEVNAPWFIKVITILGAWFGSLLFLGSLILAQALQSKESMITFGSIFILTGIILSYTNKKNHLLDSTSLSFLCSWTDTAWNRNRV